MSGNSISACLIVKNEENNLPRSLRSIKKIADEIIVVDTGSTDNTIEVAKSFEAKVIEYKWINDFSDARNKSLEYATKDWILFLDADEEIDLVDGERLKSIINDSNNSNLEGLYLRLVNIVGGKNVGDAVVFRVFRNNKDYRFKGRMHEQIINSIQDKKGQESIGSTDIKILHYGYDPNVKDQLKKCERNINLLLSYDEKDKDGYYYYSLANEYTRTNRFDLALETYNKSISLIDFDSGSIPIFYPYLMVALMNLLYSLRRYKEELEYIDVFKRRCKDFKDIYFQEALIYIERSSFTKAKESLKSYLNCLKNTSNYTYPSTNFNQYNISDIMNQLKIASVDHEENLISSIIIYNDKAKIATETLKSLNEVSSRVIVAIPNTLNIDTNELVNLGAVIVKTSSSDEEEMFFESLKKCHGKYNLKMKIGEVFSAIAQKEIIKLLANSNKDLYKINIITLEGKHINKEVRIFRNSRKFKKYTDFKNYIEGKKIQEANLYIHNICKLD